MRTDTPFYLANTVHRLSFRPAEILPCGKIRGNDVLEGGKGLGVAFESRNGITARAMFPAATPLKVAGTAVEKMYFPAAFFYGTKGERFFRIADYLTRKI